jgi:peroxiredoxin
VKYAVAAVDQVATRGISQLWRSVRVVAFAVCALLALLGVAFLLLRPANSESSHTSPLPGIALGGLAPDFVLPDLHGHPVQLSSLRGRWILLNFWGVTCPPCRSEMPALERAFAGLSRTGNAGSLEPTILGVDGDLDPPGTVNGFVRSLHVTYPIMTDTLLTVMTRYHVGELPTSVAIDPSGRVAKVFLGQLSNTQIDSALRGRA